MNGYYAGNMGNFTQLAADMNAQVTIKQPGETITAQDLEDVALLVVSAPIKYTQDGIEATAENRFSNEFIDVVAAYVQGGGTVIVCGLADYQDGNNPGENNEYTTYGQINKLLEGMGATMKVNDDELIDQDENGGQAYRLYFDDFHFESTDSAVQAALAGLEGSDKVYSSYSGCSVYVGEGTAIVFGHDTTYSINSKNPAQGHNKPVQSYSDAYDPEKAVVTKGDVVSLATEAVGQGRVYVGGTVWLSDFEIANSEGNDYGDASYANKTILENILSGLLKEQEVSPIAEVRENAAVGAVFTVEGTITAGNVEPNAFYDTIYIQDDTGGINIYPVTTTDGAFRVGQKVWVTGSWDQYQGDTELRCISIELIDSAVNPMTPAELEITQASHYDMYGGLLAKVGGTVKSVEMEGSAISTVILTDGTDEFRLLFNNYIGYSDETSPDITTFVEEGAEISAVGVIYMDPEGVCLRVRDLSEVELAGDQPNEPGNPGGPVTPNPDVTTTTTTEPDGTVTTVATNTVTGEVTTTKEFPNGVRMVTVDRPGEDVTATVSIPEDMTSATVTIPVDGATPGTVAVIVHPDGSETVVRKSVAGEDGVTLTLEAGASIKLVDNRKDFGDVPEDAWYSDAVAFASSHELFNGTGDTTFAPNTAMTRGMLVRVLHNLESNPGGESSTGFSDVTSGAWYADAVQWAAQQGIVKGYGNGQFGPGDSITREQLAVMLWRYAGCPAPVREVLDFHDGDSVSGWAMDAMLWAVENSLIRGDGTNLNPAANATRAQVAAVLMRLIENMLK